MFDGIPFAQLSHNSDYDHKILIEMIITFHARMKSSTAKTPRRRRQGLATRGPFVETLRVDEGSPH